MYTGRTRVAIVAAGVDDGSSGDAGDAIPRATRALTGRNSSAGESPSPVEPLVNDAGNVMREALGGGKEMRRDDTASPTGVSIVDDGVARDARRLAAAAVALVCS